MQQQHCRRRRDHVCHHRGIHLFEGFVHYHWNWNGVHFVLGGRGGIDRGGVMDGDEVLSLVMRRCRCMLLVGS